MDGAVNYRGQEYNIDEDNHVNINGKKYIAIRGKGDIEIIKQYHKRSRKKCDYYFFDIDISIADFFISSGDITRTREGGLEDLWFSSSIFNKNVDLGKRIIGSRIIYALFFVNSDFVQGLLFDFYSVEVSSQYTAPRFFGCNFGKKLKIRNHEATSNQGKPLLEKDKYSYYQQNKAKLKELKIIDCTADEGAYLRIGFLSVAEFILSNLRLPNNAELNIGDCFFHNFRISNFRNIGKFKLYKINNFSKEKPNKKIKNKEGSELPTTFQIDNTSIGKTDFQGLNLVDFEEIKMFDNIFTELDYTNVTWSNKEIKVGQYDDHSAQETLKKKNRKLGKQQDTYRTLKNVATRNNDQPQAIQFFAKEMGFHYQLVKNNKEYSLSDRATLWFNKHTNNFGLSFWKPLGWLFVFSILLYILLLHLLPISLSLDISGDVSKFFARFFILLNPLHKIKDVFGGHWSGLAYAIDFIFRVIESLLIYQTVQAFRKYGRKL